MLTIVVLSALLVVGAAAETAPAPPVNTCSEDPHFRDFDFWLGEWDVTMRSSGQSVGTNRITSIEQGCAIQENWTSRRGTTGMSLNWYDPTRQLWRQIWVAVPGYVIDIEGGLQDGDMVLQGTITTYGDQSTEKIRGRWTPNEDGTVRQFFEQYSAEDESWQPWFDGIYTPIAQKD